MSETSSDYLLKKCIKLHIPIQKICAKDELPDILNTGAYIVNMANNGNPGTHWTCFYYDKPRKRMFYCDSFGIVYPNEILDACCRNDVRSITYNTKEIQNIQSGYCGIYCLAFLYYLSNYGPNVKTIMKFDREFSSDTKQNKRILLKIMGDKLKS